MSSPPRTLSLVPFVVLRIFAGTALAIPLVMSLLPLWAAAGPASGDPARGKALFEKRCTGCHSLDQDKEGPHLRGVYMRPAASLSGFTYSDALKASRITWDDESLDRWLADPDAFVPNNDMAFHVPDPDNRGDLIAYLRTMPAK